MFLSNPSVLLFLAAVQHATADSWRFGTVANIFLQDNDATDLTSYNYATINDFGLIPKCYDNENNCNQASPPGGGWQRLSSYIGALNTDPKVKYKLLYLSTSGESIADVSKQHYGSNWDCYWSQTNGNGSASWLDAKLTPKGMSQAGQMSDFWTRMMTQASIPVAQSYYVSPLWRAVQTATVAFAKLALPPAAPFKPVAKEGFRNAVSGKTPDQRSSKWDLQKAFPQLAFEPGFQEKDPLWMAGVGETRTDMTVRSYLQLSDVFDKDPSQYISITSHPEEIAAILRAIKHRDATLSPGNILPVLVQGQRVTSAPDPTLTQSEPYTSVTTCPGASSSTVAAPGGGGAASVSGVQISALPFKGYLGGAASLSTTSSSTSSMSTSTSTVAAGSIYSLGGLGLADATMTTMTTATTTGSGAGMSMSTTTSDSTNATATDGSAANESGKSSSAAAQVRLASPFVYLVSFVLAALAFPALFGGS